jgi:hypothetical protein
MEKDSGILDLEQARQSTSPYQKAGEERDTDSMIGQHGFLRCSETTMIPPAILCEYLTRRKVYVHLENKSLKR